MFAKERLVAVFFQELQIKDLSAAQSFCFPTLCNLIISSTIESTISCSVEEPTMTVAEKRGTYTYICTIFFGKGLGPISDNQRKSFKHSFHTPCEQNSERQGSARRFLLQVQDSNVDYYRPICRILQVC